MDPTSSLERLVETLDLTRRRGEEQEAEARAGGPSQKQAPPAITITLSREAGTSGKLIARVLGERLGWPVYDHELLQRVADEMGLRTSLLESVDERRKSWLVEAVESFAAVPAVSRSAYVRRLVETVLSLGVHGDCIIVGRGAGHVLPAETTLQVRVVAPLKARVATVMRDRNMSREEAAREVEATDRERVHFVKEYFHKDPRDPALYDLVLNAASFSATECADIALEALRRMQARTSARPREPVKA